MIWEWTTSLTGRNVYVDLIDIYPDFKCIKDQMSQFFIGHIERESGVTGLELCD